MRHARLADLGQSVDGSIRHVVADDSCVVAQWPSIRPFHSEDGSPPVPLVGAPRDYRMNTGSIIPKNQFEEQLEFLQLA